MNALVLGMDPKHVEVDIGFVKETDVLLGGGGSGGGGAEQISQQQEVQ